MRKIFLSAVFLINTIGFSQNIDDAKFNQLSKIISENTCDCVQQAKKNNGEWIETIEPCLVESFKKNELKVKEIVGTNYLEEENVAYILQIIKDAEGYWVDVCSDKLQSEIDFVPNLTPYFSENVTLKYDLISFSQNKQEISGEVIQEIELDGVFEKSYVDEEKSFHVVFKDDNDETQDILALDDFENFTLYLKQKQLKANQKIKIKFLQVDFVDKETGKNVTVKKILDIQKI